MFVGGVCSLVDKDGNMNIATVVVLYETAGLIEAQNSN